MAEFVEAIFDQLDDRWVQLMLGGILMGVGWFFGHRRAKSDWKKKEFLHRLNISLNMLEDGTLRFRTLLEKSCKEVFLNELASTAIHAAALKTTEEDPVLPLEKDEYWYYLNAVLNEISEKFAEGQIRREMGQPVQVATYLICLTCECDGRMRTRKIRAMVIRRDLLESLPKKTPKFESSKHDTRWRTLNQLARTWKSEPFKFLTVELCV